MEKAYFGPIVYYRYKMLCIHVYYVEYFRNDKIIVELFSK